jgi:methionyl-tRNA formyltransferase
MKTFSLFLVGQKGAETIEKLSLMPEFVVSYRDRNIVDVEYDRICHFCEVNHIPFFDRKEGYNVSADIDFYIGWQYLIKDNLENSIVLHDSYLPHLKGFAPTPTALINGLNLGATAFKPTEKIDEGDVYIRTVIPVEHPIRLKDAYVKIGGCYADIIQTILDSNIISHPINAPVETYSIWRDKEDMFIDWSDDSKKIIRFVYALGYPLDGAKTHYNGHVIVIKEIELLNEMSFIERHYGKIWSIQNNQPVVVCGSGMVKILEATYEDGSNVIFNKLRVRMQ